MGRNKQKCLLKILQARRVFFLSSILDQHLWQGLEPVFFFFFFLKGKNFSPKCFTLFVSRILRSSLQKTETYFIMRQTSLFKDLNIRFIYPVILGMLLILSSSVRLFTDKQIRGLSMGSPVPAAPLV